MDYFDLDLLGLMFEPATPRMAEEDENMGDEAYVFIAELDEDAY